MSAERKDRIDVGQTGRYGGVVVWRRGNQHAEALVYSTGKVEVFVYRLGPRGGRNASHLFTTPEKLREEARRLQEIAYAVEVAAGAS